MMDRCIVIGSWPKNLHAQGFTYLAVLFFIALVGATLSMTGVMWSTQRQREKEQDLLFIGNEYRKAIANYYEHSPGSVKRYPNSLDELLIDNRHLTTQRYLRRLYPDPMTAAMDWEIIRASDGGIMGVRSASTAQPLKSSNFLLRDQAFEHAKSYREWRFVYEPIRSNRINL